MNELNEKTNNYLPENFALLKLIYLKENHKQLIIHYYYFIIPNNLFKN